MRYEIITDSRDMLVLVVNSRVVEVSSNMSEICNAIEEDHFNRMNKVEKTDNKDTNIASDDNSSSLGKLFTL